MAPRRAGRSKTPSKATPQPEAASEGVLRKPTYYPPGANLGYREGVPVTATPKSTPKRIIGFAGPRRSGRTLCANLMPYALIVEDWELINKKHFEGPEDVAVCGPDAFWFRKFIECMGGEVINLYNKHDPDAGVIERRMPYLMNDCPKAELRVKARTLLNEMGIETW